MRDEIVDLNQATIIAVRGALTKSRVNGAQRAILGDPGLLADLIVPSKFKKSHVIGLVPHYVDKLDLRLNRLSKIPGIKVINVDRNVRPVLKEISQCEYILSSSLHGLVVADSYGIPNAWIEMSDKVVGNGFKFRDYASAFSEDILPHPVSGFESLKDLIHLCELRSSIEETKKSLHMAFDGIRSLV